MTPTRMSFVTAILSFVSIFGFTPLQSQNATPAGMQSIGDMVRQADAHNATLIRPDIIGLNPNPNQGTAAPIHILYMHGMNAAGANDSALLRKGLCKYLKECNTTQLPRIYADSGPFDLNDPYVPSLTYMGTRIWKTKDEWNASTPFIDRYQISSPSHVPIILDELNWYPLVYPLKCNWLIRPDASLTGPAKSQIDVCAAIRKDVKGEASPPDTTHPGLYCVYNKQQGTQPDQDSAGHYCAYEWISQADAKALKKLPRKSMLVNRSLKSGVMDWGFGDPVLVLGPMQEILTSGIRQLLVKSLKADGVDVANAKALEGGPQFMFITHSLGSYLSLAALDSDWLGPQHPELPTFGITPEERAASDYFLARTAGFFFLANQVELLELGRLAVESAPPPNAAPDPCTKVIPSRTAVGQVVEPAIMMRWPLLRQDYVAKNHEKGSCPGIFAWSDPSDLLSWEVPEIYGVSVKNTQVRNPGWKKLPPFLAWPIDSHDNYAGNKKVLQAIFQ